MIKIYPALCELAWRKGRETNSLEESQRKRETVDPLTRTRTSSQGHQRGAKAGSEARHGLYWRSWKGNQTGWATCKNTFQNNQKWKKKKGMYMGAGGTNGPSRRVGGTGWSQDKPVFKDKLGHVPVDNPRQSSMTSFYVKGIMRPLLPTSRWF